MTVESAALVLGSGSDAVLRGTLERMSATARLYPASRALSLGVTSVGVTTPDGVLLRTSFHGAGGAGLQTPGSAGETAESTRRRSKTVHTSRSVRLFNVVSAIVLG